MKLVPLSSLFDPNPAQQSPKPGSKLLKPSRFNPFITPFSPSAKVSVSASSRGNKRPPRRVSYSNVTLSQDSFLTPLTPNAGHWHVIHCSNPAA